MEIGFLLCVVLSLSLIHQQLTNTALSRLSFGGSGILGGGGWGALLFSIFVVCFCQMSHPLSNRIQQKKKILTVPRLCLLKVVSYCSACFRMMSSIYLYSVDRVCSTTSSWMPSPTSSCWYICVYTQTCLISVVSFNVN